VTSVRQVPETTIMAGAELTADDAWATLRQAGAWPLARAAAARFRYGDGFSHSRALGLQLSLAVVPLVIAFVGLGSTLHARRPGQVLRRTLLSLTPGGGDDVLADVLRDGGGDRGDGGTVALWLGLLVAVLALTTAMGQVERGANRIYGIRRDRPAPRKYGRALLLAAGAGVPSVVGFLVLVAAADFADAVEAVYGVDDDAAALVGLPVGGILLLGSVTVMMRFAPRRRQPGWSWLALGAAIALVLWLLFTGCLSAYLQLSDSFGTVYGPLTGIMALLLWAQLTSVAIFLGLAVAAQLEAVRAGVQEGAEPDRLSGGLR
jgi:YihY family inner membrane protein